MEVVFVGQKVNKVCLRQFNLLNKFVKHFLPRTKLKNPCMVLHFKSNTIGYIFQDTKPDPVSKYINKSIFEIYQIPNSIADCCETFFHRFKFSAQHTQIRKSSNENACNSTKHPNTSKIL